MYFFCCWYFCRNIFFDKISLTSAMMVRDVFLTIKWKLCFVVGWWLGFSCDQRMKLRCKHSFCVVFYSNRWDESRHCEWIGGCRISVNGIASLVTTNWMKHYAKKQLLILNYSCLLPQHCMLNVEQYSVLIQDQPSWIYSTNINAMLPSFV